MFENWDRNDVIVVGLIGIAIVMFIVVVGTSWVESECLSKGYREGRIDYRWRGFCITRVDQTDRVVPLRELR